MPDEIINVDLPTNQTQISLPDGQVVQYKIITPLTPLQEAQKRLDSFQNIKTLLEKDLRVKSYNELLKKIANTQSEIEQLTQ
jgi:hypothetical protein